MSEVCILCGDDARLEYRYKGGVCSSYVAHKFCTECGGSAGENEDGAWQIILQSVFMAGLAEGKVMGSGQVDPPTPGVTEAFTILMGLATFGPQVMPEELRERVAGAMERTRANG